MKSVTKTITAVGDVLAWLKLADEIAKENIEQKRVELSEILKDGDMVVGNLEGPVTDREQSHKNQLWLLKMPALLAPLLSVFSGFSIANNHILDYNLEGLDETIDRLDELGIKHCGAGHNIDEAARPALFDLDGFLVGMTAFTDRNWYPAGPETPGTQVWQGQKSTDAIRCLAQETDFVIVQIHQGYEFIDYLGPEEILAAQRAVDAGADLVLAHHSHSLMGIKRRGDAVIAYGLGNFLFDNSHIPVKYMDRVNRRAIFQFEIARHKVLAYDIIPYTSDRYGWPVPATEEEASSTLAYFRMISDVLEDESETLRRFRRQAGKNMLPHAIQSLAALFRKEGMRSVLQRLARLRWVDFSVVCSHLYHRIRNIS